MLTKQQIYALVKSSAKPQGFAQSTGRNAWLSACKVVVDKVRDVNNVPTTGPKPGGGE